MKEIKQHQKRLRELRRDLKEILSATKSLEWLIKADYRAGRDKPVYLEDTVNVLHYRKTYTEGQIEKVEEELKQLQKIKQLQLI